MRHKGLISSLTVIFSILSVYYISFTFVVRRVEQEVAVHATDEQGNIDFAKRQKLLEAKAKEIIYKPLWGYMGSYTYEQAKAREIGLGLDLQGGVHLTFKVVFSDFIKNLAKDGRDKELLAILQESERREEEMPEKDFFTHFQEVARQLAPRRPLRTFFLKAAHRKKLSSQATDREVMAFVRKQFRAASEDVLRVLRARIDYVGTSGSTLYPGLEVGSYKLDFPGSEHADRMQYLVEQQAKLTFYAVSHDEKAMGDFLARADRLLKGEEEPVSKSKKKKRKKSHKKAAQEQEKEGISSYLVLREGRLFCLAERVEQVRALLKRPEIRELFPEGMTFLTSKETLPQADRELHVVYGLQQTWDERGLLDGTAIAKASMVYEKGQPAIEMKMNTQGTLQWRKVTGKHVGKQIAIALDDQIYSAPKVSSEIPNGVSRITGDFSPDQARNLVNVLTSGRLEQKVVVVERVITGGTMGEKAQAQGILSILLGLILVLLFMLAYYALGGLVANFALLFNMIFILGTLSQLNASLSLSGIAGIVLTIGMSIDANVLIFERIREELRKGNPIRLAISTGFNKAYSSVMDSNITTLLIGLILYYIGQGPIKGFATTLIIGIISSVFTAVFVSRLLLELLGSWLGLERLSFSWSFSSNFLSRLSIDFLGIRKRSYLFSVFFIGVGAGAIFYKGGLKPGIDFVGGRTYVLELSQKTDMTQLKEALSQAFDHESTEVKTYGGESTVKVTTAYKMNSRSQKIEKEAQDRLVKAVEKITGEQLNTTGRPAPKTFIVASQARIGATVAEDIKRSAQWAILFSLLVIFLYILLRFRRWGFGLAAVLALLHDTLALFSAFGLAALLGRGYEIDLVFIASILTVIGYSINDTVVVFDRVRELVNLHKGYSLRMLVNRAINETMSRTLITSMTTFIAVLVLFLFGGEELASFSFAMMVGIIFGTYSSIFIATPLAMDFAHRHEKGW